MGRELVEVSQPERRERPAGRDAPAPRSQASVLQLQQTAGNQAVQRLLSRPSRPMIQRAPYIVQAGYMSGDMFGISAALVLNPQAGVVILQETSATEIAKREPDQGQLFADFYRQSLRARGVRAEDIARRVKLVSMDDVQAVYKDLVSGGADHGATVRKNAALADRDSFVAAGIATSMVGDEYKTDSAKARAAVRQAWTSGPGPTNEQLAQFLAGKGIQRGGKYALLWVRLSAKLKKGGAHAELDTSLEGVRNLKAEIRRQTDREVVLVGDDPAKPEFLENAINMLQFWDHAPFSTPTDRVEKRMAQLRLFSYMVQNGFDLVSIGMRSGAMEGPALLGVPTVYIEDEDNMQAGRMQKWLNKVPNWTQARVETLPTRTGRRYKAGAVRLPLHAEDYNRATAAVSRHTGEKEADVRNRLEASHVDDLRAFQQAFIEASLVPWQRDLPRAVIDYKTYVKEYEDKRGSGWSTTLRALLRTWHREYRVYWAAEDECERQEQAIADVVGGDPRAVRDKLERLRTTLDRNAGLADFVRDALVALAPVPPGDDVKKVLRTALRKWRSVYTGKAELSKGFTPSDLERLMSTPTLDRDRFVQRIRTDHATLLGEIDELVSEAPGTTAGKLYGWVTRGGKPNFEAFRKSFLEAVAPGLRRLLKLQATAALGDVQTAYGNHLRTTAGTEWWNKLRPKLEQLHRLLWPA